MCCRSSRERVTAHALDKYTTIDGFVATSTPIRELQRCLGRKPPNVQLDVDENLYFIALWVEQRLEPVLDDVLEVDTTTD